jgi:hypothetical protein
MKTDQQLLDEYTQLLTGEHKRTVRQREILKEIEQNGKDDSKRLRVAIRRIVRDTKWTIEKCSYWPLINHSKRPVTATMQGTLELYHFRENPRGMTKLEINFNPSNEECTLLYVEGIINSTKP